MDTNTNDTDSSKYRILLSTENTMIVTTDLIKSRNVPYLGSIPIYFEDYIKISKIHTQEETDSIISPEVLSPLQQEFKSWYDNLSHSNFKYLFRLENLESLHKYLQT